MESKDQEEKKDITKEQVAKQVVSPSNKPLEEIDNNDLQTKEDLLAELKKYKSSPSKANKQVLDSLKNSFYKLVAAENFAAKEVFITNGGDEQEFVPSVTPQEEEFNSLFAEIKKIRKNHIAEQEKIKEENLNKKLLILEQLKQIVESGEDTGKQYHTFKDLQKKWTGIKSIPQGRVNELWQSYEHVVEQFYDLLKLNNEFREYDFKKNLELKNKICEKAESLTKEEDIVSAFHQLQDLHQEFREIGPIAKELREEVWNRFKEASVIINKKHQQHFINLKEQERDNLKNKTAICEKIEAIDYTELTNHNQWKKLTDEVIELQRVWRTIGFVPKKQNTLIFDRFRTACDLFFENKSQFYKNQKEAMGENLKQKEALCLKAEELKESKDWSKTSDILIKLQEDWKKIGPIPRKHANALWKRFISACDYFFEQRKKVNASQQNQENENLEKKNALIQELKELKASNEDPKTISTRVHEIIKTWNKTGHVPYRLKDKLYKDFHGLIDQFFDKFNTEIAQQKLSNFIEDVKDLKEEGALQQLYREREKLIRIADRMKNELLTYENNLGFLTASSKKGDTVVNEFTRKVDRLKDDLKLMNKKIKAIEKSIRDEDNK